MIKVFVTVSALIGLTHSVLGQIIFSGQCNPNLPAVVLNFNATRFLGRWHAIESYPSEFQLGSCIDATYSEGYNGTVDIFNTEVVNETLSTILGNGELAADGSGRLRVTFNTTFEASDYWVLDTDYDDFAFVYSCENRNLTRAVWSWKLSRSRSLSPTANTRINAIINLPANVDLVAANYQAINNSADDCFYFPEPSLLPTRFRSTCARNSLNMPIVANFNTTRYLGRWNLIESYPSVFQIGTCTTADYSLGWGGVDVVNAQVVNATLNTVEGFATVASVDGSGILNVSFPIAGTNLTTDSPYWVLDTDYESYALVYSCVDVEDGHSEVYSWKMSRSKLLSATAVTAINNVTSGVQVLDERYFQLEDQTPEGCFFFPEPQPGVPVVFPGQCDTNLTVLSNFSLELFSNVWHEIEAYPTQQQMGECINHNFSGSGVSDTLNVLTSSVIGTTINFSFNGTLTSAFNDSSSRFTLTIDANGTEIPFWIIDTDYNNYALAYSCINVDNYFRAVYSWKLSRTRTLNNAANIAIANAMSGIDVLDNTYFEAVNQTNDACFHYPDFEELPGAITLPGPCPAISGVANFNATRYLGTWIEIERYPQPDQDGQCSRAEYTQSGSLAIDVYNHHVVNRTLRYQRGVATAPSDNGVLTVIFIIGGVNYVSNLYILATDYDNFALAYSCRDIQATGNRQVFSWKLSRSTSLSVQANNTINDMIERTQGLRQDYYTVTDQSEQACLYIPQAVREQDVHLRGRCPTVTGEPNFNLQSYLGWWHEERSYPTANNTGACISSRYRQVGNLVEFEDTQVFGNTAEVNRGTVQASSNGLLSKTFANGQREDTWVLRTDYENFAVLFRCTPSDFDPDYVRVYSAVQSKSRNLTPNVEALISQVISGNIFLENSLFLPVSQTADSCFHLPAAGEMSERVILRGQCDLDIPVQANFSISEYAGTWYQTERYPYPEISVNATCIGTRLTTSGANAVNILKWNMEDEALITIQAVAAVNSSLSQLDVTVSPNTPANATATVYVLTTDYTSFSLVYTCENLNPFERAVVAFKLGRARTLPAAANTAINTYMATRQELHQPYFLQVQQPDTCQDPSSSYLVKSSIIVVLLCYMLSFLS